MFTADSKLTGVDLSPRATFLFRLAFKPSNGQLESSGVRMMRTSAHFSSVEKSVGHSVGQEY